MKTVIRHDRATLRRPERTPQGFLRADGLFGRAGVYEYRNDDGTIRRELRPLSEVQHPDALASFADASLTIGHPRRADGEPDDVNASNVRRHEVGSVSGSARADGDAVVGAVVVKDAKAIKTIESGQRELSPGYRIELDETPGVDPKYGRYDAIQRKIRVNHLAIVEHARGGSQCRLRLDEAERADSTGKLTTATAGHQHLVDCQSWDGCERSSGETSSAVADGADIWHTHPFVRDATGVITIGEAAGHTHAILDANSEYAATQMPRADGHFDRSGTHHESGPMATTPPAGTTPPPDAAEQIRLLTVRADEADRVASERRDAIERTTRESDGLRAELATARERIATLEAQAAAGASALETAAIGEQRRRADAAERELSELRSGQPAQIRQRAGLIAKAQAVLGPDFRADGLTDREILVAGLRRLRPKEDVGPSVSHDYLQRRFDSLVEERATYSASLGRASEALTIRQDAAPQPAKPAVPWNDRWKSGAGRFATRKDS